MPASDCALTVLDRHNVLHDTNVGALVKRWLNCGESGMPVSRRVSSEVDCSFVHCYEKVKYEENLSTPVRCFHEQPLLKLICHFLSSVGHLVTCISPNASVTGSMTATLSFNYSSGMGDVRWMAKPRIDRHHKDASGESSCQDSGFQAISEGVWFALQIKAPGLCIALWLHCEISSLSGFGLHIVTSDFVVCTLLFFCCCPTMAQERQLWC